MSIAYVKTIRYVVSPSPLGHMLLATFTGKVCALLFISPPDAARQQLESLFHGFALVSGGDLERDILSTVVTYLSNGSPAPPRVQFHLTGTPFQIQVWDLISSIPQGQTCTYGNLAQRLGRPGAVRAVAMACAANKIAVLLPCHRVVGKNGILTGYRWGIDRKRFLLKMEERGSRHYQNVI